MTDLVDQQLKQLCGQDFNEKSVEKRQKLRKKAVNYTQFKPQVTLESPCNVDSNYDNPAISDHCESLDWNGGWTPVNRTEVLTAYPEYLPTETAIETLQRYDPILEVGAGFGYWAFVLSNAGCDIIPTDLHPIDVEISDVSFWDDVEQTEGFFECPRTGVHSVNRAKFKPSVPNDKYPNVPWATVKIADHSIVNSHPNHTILSCHPPTEKWTEELLDFVSIGQKFVFIGEWYPGMDATPFFFKELSQWKLIESFPVYDWKTMHTHGYVFEKT